MGAVKGIDIIWLYRVLEDASTEAAFKIGYQMENEVSEARDADLTMTKDGGVRVPGTLETEGSMTSLYAVGDTYIKKMRNALKQAKLCEFWEINKAETDGTIEVDKLTVTAAATSTSTITITLDGVAKTVAVESGDTINQVAAKVRGTSFPGWVVGGADAIVTFTALVAESKTAPVFSGGTTGVTATISATTAGVDSTGKFAGTYYQGYVTEYSATQGAEDMVEVSLSYAMEGEGQDGYCTLTEAQAETVQYVFTDTTQQ